MIVDTARLGTARDAPGGGVYVPARIGRSGVQVYRRPDGSTVRAWRPADEVRAADFSGAPLTVGHPPEGVSAENWRQVAVGAVRQHLGTERVGRDEFVRADLHVADAAAIADLGTKLVECSCCYGCAKDWTPGLTPDGESYDVVFRALTPNHVALGGPGFARAGREARLIADGENEMDVFLSDLVADSAETPAPAAAPAAPAPSDRDQLVADAAVLREENTRLTAELDAARDKVKQLQAQVEGLPKAVADGVAAELALRTRVAPILGAEYAFDGKSSREIKVDAVKKLSPEKEIADSVTEAYLDAYLDAAGELKVHDHNESHGPEARERVSDGKSVVAEKTKNAFFLNRRAS